MKEQRGGGAGCKNREGVKHRGGGVKHRGGGVKTNREEEEEE